MFFKSFCCNVLSQVTPSVRFQRSLNRYFAYGEVILAPVHAIVKHPESLSFVEAASI
jgi:hypothetical protein